MPEKNQLTKSLRLLVLDPDPKTAADCSLAFSGRGWTVDGAGTFAEALALVSQNSYDLAIIELLLPDLDGTEAWSRIKARAPTILGILTTSSPSLRTSIVAEERGILAYLQKPLRMTALVDFIHETLQHLPWETDRSDLEQHLAGLYELVASLAQTDEPALVLERGLAQLGTWCRFDYLALFSPEERTQWSASAQPRAFGQGALPTLEQRQFISERALEALHSLQMVIWSSGQGAERYGYAHRLDKVGLANLVLIPLAADHTPYAVLAAADVKATEIHSPPWKIDLMRVAGQALNLGLARARAVQDLGAQGIHDRASGVFSSAFLEASVEHALATWKRHARPFSLVLLGWSRMQDALNADQESRFSRELAAVVKSCFRCSDVVALEDHHLAFLLPETTREGAQRVAARIEGALKAHWAARPDQVMPSFRIHVECPSDETRGYQDLVRLVSG